MFKHQKGATLVVALMITIVMGILAVGISKVATSGQRRENANFGNAVSQANAVAGIEAARGFIRSVVLQNGGYEASLFKPADSTNVTDKTQYNVGGKTINLSDIIIKQYYQGVEPQFDNTKIQYGVDNTVLWFRNNDEWVANDANSIVNVLGNENVSYRIDLRDGGSSTNVGIGPGMANRAEIGYRYLRVTARGQDPSTNASTILQTHVGILGEK